MTSWHPKRVWGRPVGDMSPSWTAFFNRNSIGSMPSFSAISSITVSTAWADWGWPGARYDWVFGLLTTTSYPSTRILSILYAPRAGNAPPPTGEPG